jgi:hypothetical protein
MWYDGNGIPQITQRVPVCCLVQVLPKVSTVSIAVAHTWSYLNTENKLRARTYSRDSRIPPWKMIGESLQGIELINDDLLLLSYGHSFSLPWSFSGEIWPTWSFFRSTPELRNLNNFGPKISIYTDKVKTKQWGVLLVAIALLCIMISFFLKLDKNGWVMDEKRMHIYGCLLI